MALEPKPWGLRALAVLAGGMLLSTSTAGTLMALALKLGWVSADRFEVVGAIVVGISTQVFSLAAIGVGLRLKGVPLVDAFGLNRGSCGYLLKNILLSCLVIFPLVFMSSIIWRDLLMRCGRVPEEQDLVRMIKGLKAVWEQVYFVGFAALLAPVCEEVFFRGFVYPVLKPRLGIAVSITLVSISFAAAHFSLAAFGPLFVLAMLLGMAYEYFGNILIPIAIHSLFNTLSLLVMFLCPSP